MLQQSIDTLAVREMLLSDGITLSVLADANEALAKSCGVYSTPQAVLLNVNSIRYYRGNYNRSRYCTDKNTSYANPALAAITTGEKVPQFSKLATTAYSYTLSERSFSLLTF